MPPPRRGLHQGGDQRRRRSSRPSQPRIPQSGHGRRAVPITWVDDLAIVVVTFRQQPCEHPFAPGHISRCPGFRKSAGDEVGDRVEASWVAGESMPRHQRMVPRRRRQAGSRDAMRQAALRPRQAAKRWLVAVIGGHCRITIRAGQGL
jgi:hypothetical protein